MLKPMVSAISPIPRSVLLILRAAGLGGFQRSTENRPKVSWKGFYVPGLNAARAAAFIRAQCVVIFAAEETARLLCGVQSIPQLSLG